VTIALDWILMRLGEMAMLDRKRLDGVNETCKQALYINEYISSKYPTASRVNFHTHVRNGTWDNICICQPGLLPHRLQLVPLKTEL